MDWSGSPSVGWVECCGGKVRPAERHGVASSSLVSNQAPGEGLNGRFPPYPGAGPVLSRCSTAVRTFSATLKEWFVSAARMIRPSTASSRSPPPTSLAGPGFFAVPHEHREQAGEPRLQVGSPQRHIATGAFCPSSGEPGLAEALVVVGHGGLRDSAPEFPHLARGVLAAVPVERYDKTQPGGVAEREQDIGQPHRCGLGVSVIPHIFIVPLHAFDGNDDGRRPWRLPKHVVRRKQVAYDALC